MPKLYRIFTERKNVPKLETLVNAYFEASTFVLARGYWKGKAEASLIIEITAEASDLPKVRELCRAIDVYNQQECTLLQTIEVESELI